MNYPPLDLLDPVPTVYASDQEDHSREIVNTLAANSVTARINKIQRGAAVIRYLLELDEGGDPRKVERLTDPLSLACKVTVRYAGTLNGYVAVEVPRAHRDTVNLREVIVLGKATPPLGLAIGQNVAGASVCASLALAPHILVAGATGQGKSVWLNAALVSLLMRHTPAELELVLIDPKRVELAAYAGLPHLMLPIISDMADAAGALHDQVRQMEWRYAQMESAGVKDLASWNNANPNQSWARRVIVIDELADLMMTHGKAVETSIARLGQLGRAAGIHLIVATQRPAAEVVTGKIKANIPSRLALTVASQVDAKVAGVAGAERLSSKGDALWSAVGQLMPERVQTPLVTDREVAAVVDWWINEWAAVTWQEPTPESQAQLASALKMVHDAVAVEEVDEVVSMQQPTQPIRRITAAPVPLLDVADPMDLLVLEMVEEMKRERPVIVLDGDPNRETLSRVERLEKAVILLAEAVAR